MNYMEEIAHMLGLEIGEEFKIEGLNNYKYRFDDNLMTLMPDGRWYTAPAVLNKILEGKYKIIKPILTEEEREYLSMVIKPFKDEVYYICKNSYNRKFGWIQIGIKDDLCINLPTLKVGTMMYKGMEFDKRYSLEELDL